MKRKLTTAAAALLAACILCSCGGNSGGAPQESDTEAQTSVETKETSSGEDGAADTSADDLTDIDQAAAMEEIRDTLADFGDFSYMYLYCREYGEEGMLDEKDTITKDGYEYRRAVGGDFETYSGLMAAIDGFCTERVSEELGFKSKCYAEGENDGLYIWTNANGVRSYNVFQNFPLDMSYIRSADFGSGSVTLHCRAAGADYWEYDYGDVTEDFDITMARYDGVWKISECGLHELDLLTWTFNPDYDEEEY